MKFRYLLLIGAFIFLYTVQVVHAEESGEISSSPIPEVAYTLPHPGLLPGHILYGLKSARDNFMGFLISNPLKKAEFNLLQADKHIQASYLLIMGEKKDVAAASLTFEKGKGYFREAVQKTSDAKKQGLDTSDITKRLTLASMKYKEVVQIIEKGISEKEREQFKKEKAELDDLLKSAKQLEK